MEILTIAVLKKIIENVPDDYTVEFIKNDNISFPAHDKFVIDVSEKKICFK